MSQEPESQLNQIYSDPDVLLMLEVQKGHQAPFESLMRKYYKRIYNFIYRFVGHRQLAEDLTQDVFIRVYKSADSYHPKAKFQTWIYTIAKNLSLNELRKKSSRNSISLEQEIPTSRGAVLPQVEDPRAKSLWESMAQEEKQSVVREAIQSLPENQRMAVILRRYEDLSYEQIAQTLQCSVPAVKSLLNRAKEGLKGKLRNVMGDY